MLIVPQPALAKDVSKFLKGLKFDGTHLNDPDAQPEKLSKTKSHPKASAATATKHSQLKDVQPIPRKPGESSIAKPEAAKPIGPSPKLPKSNFVVEPTPQWYISRAALAPAPTPTLTPAKLTALTTHAAMLHANTVATYQSQSSSTATTTTSDFSFLQKILQGGTLSDRLSALTLLVQSSPVHNVKALETLKGIAERGKGKGGREESLKALRCVVDWWVGGGVPNRKLK
jgi:ribosome biogenesis protein MAK21